MSSHATFESLATRLEDRVDGESTMDALRTWIVGLLDEEDSERERERKASRRAVIAANEALVAHERRLMGRFEVLLAEAIAADLGEQPDDVGPRLVAAAAAAALLALQPEPGACAPTSEAELLAPLDEAFAFLRGGIAALERRRSPARA